MDLVSEWIGMYSKDVYRICLYFTRNEQTAVSITAQVFSEYYLQLQEQKAIIENKYSYQTKTKLCYLAIKKARKVATNGMVSEVKHDVDSTQN